MKLVVVGTGYVGLVTGACFADIGHDVTCVDNDSRKIRALLQGRMPFFEPGLEDIVAKTVAAERLQFSDDIASAAQDVEAVFIAVGTPSREYDGDTDRNFVFSAAREIALALPDDAIIVVKSTVPVGTGDEIELIVSELRAGSKVPVVSNPEFLRAGSAIDDFMRPDRVVIGANDPRARDIMRRIYAPLRPTPPILCTARRSSELIKYGANALLATKVAFINEMADLCERAGADVQDVAHAIGLDRRIGPRFLQAGPGFGGSCFRKDALALVKMGEDHDATMRISEAVVRSNESRKRTLLRKVSAALGGMVRKKTIAVWGVTFKPDTDDIRDSCAIPLVAALLDAGARVRLYDPEGLPAARAIWRDRVHAASDPYMAADEAHCVVVMTEWAEFASVDLARVRRLMAAPVMVDMRNMFAPDHMAKLKFSYHSVGRSPHPAASALRRTNGHDKSSHVDVKEPGKSHAGLAPLAVS